MRDYRGDIGRLVDGRYRLLKYCGSGASGAVFYATDSQSRREVALKLFDGADRESGNLTFMNEVKAVTALDNPYIVRLYDTGVDGGDRYIAMEYVDGTTLRDYIDHYTANGEKIPTEQIVSCAKQVLTALSAAHAKGIVHRDVTPRNVMLTKTGKLKVMDFGVAKIAESDALQGEKRAVGTAHYMSPEQAGKKNVDARSDLYSLGVILYEMATGVLPFDGATPAAIAERHLSEDPVPPRVREPAIPLGLEQIILTAMQKNPDYRFRSAAEMLKAIEKIGENPGYTFVDFADRPATEAGLRRKKVLTPGFLPALFGAVAAFLVLFAATAVLLLFFIGKEKEISLPTYYGYTYTEDMTFGDGIRLSDVTYAYSDDVPAGCIAAQSPAPGVYADSVTLRLTVSLGKKPLDVHDLVGQAATEAVARLRENGVTVYLSSARADAPAGTVLSAVSPDGAPTVGSIVVLTLSAGDAGALMPLVTDASLLRAEDALLRAGIAYTVRIGTSDDAPVGQVVAQSVAAGEPFDPENGPVVLTVSGGRGE